MQPNALHRVLALAVAWLPCFLAVPAASVTAVAQQGYHVDARVGFKMRLPSKWKRWPVEKDRRFVTGHYVSLADYPIAGRPFAHRPSLRVITLPKRPPDPASKKAEEKPAQVVEFYRDYKDYLARNLEGLINYEAENKGEIDGWPYTEYVIARRTEELVYELRTWILEHDKYTVAVEFMVLRDHARRLERRFLSCLRSLRRIPVDPAVEADPWRPPLWIREPERWRTLPLRDRLAHRVAFEKEFLRRVRDGLAPGFKARESEHFLVVSSADGRYTGEISQAADAMLEWCHRHLGAVSDDMVMKSVIRVFGSNVDYYRYRQRSSRLSHFVPCIREIVIAPGRRSPKVLMGLDDLSQGIMHHYLFDKDAELPRNLPEWVRDGLSNYMRLSKLSHGKVVFEASDFEKRTIREGKRRRVLEPVQAIVTQQTREQEGSNRSLRYERGRVFRFLFASVAKPRTSTVPVAFLSDYLVAVRAAQHEFGALEWNPGAGVVPGVGEDDTKKLLESDHKARMKLLVAVHSAACDWDERRWAAIEKAYDKFNKKP